MPLELPADLMHADVFPHPAPHTECIETHISWVVQAGDYAGLRLLPFYLYYGAMVRAKVTAIRCGQLQAASKENLKEGLKEKRPDESPQRAHDASLAECRRYLEQAARYTEPARTALVITHGISGSGKTTNSQHIAEAFGLVRVRADVERKRLYGLTATQSSAGTPGGIYSAVANARVQDRLEALAETVLQAGFPVLVDATFIRRAPRERMARLARKLQRPRLLLAFVAPADVLRTRVAQRSAQGRDASEADTSVVEKQLAACEELEGKEKAAALTIDTSRAINWEAVLPEFEALWARVEQEG